MKCFVFNDLKWFIKLPFTNDTLFFVSIENNEELVDFWNVDACVKEVCSLSINLNRFLKTIVKQILFVYLHKWKGKFICKAFCFYIWKETENALYLIILSVCALRLRRIY